MPIFSTISRNNGRLCSKKVANGLLVEEILGKICTLIQGIHSNLCRFLYLCQGSMISIGLYWCSCNRMHGKVGKSISCCLYQNNPVDMCISESIN